ncbi:MAG: Crp/Fnr family transcriptional regulator [Tenuifilaceae bacterium]|jgi:CRP-like cAMP-binding protein|uniref:Crp/Fnr family transcriptional regulator n=1 Tax=Perlabentimonas gracilis TaxID=2715279 RepID=UPI0014098405|nr:Crp/Fnr family transcriptional regulator [Perlabentimonas gracilis]MDX9771688.1 Crp/Fnr family transcriptional regulator [Tenuifilaceae bacterium]NHB68742.1 Crp/Fnr family transcriptional regulator [Perlabentimonas gracilis]
MDQNHQIYQLLGDHWLTAVVSKNDLLELLTKTTLVTYRKRETIVKRGEFSHHLVFLLNGYVKLEIEEGRRDFIIDIDSGMKFLGLPLTLTIDKHLFSIVTLTDAKVVFIPVSDILELMKKNSKLTSEIIKCGNESFVTPMLEKLTSSAQNNIRGRLAKLLLHLSTKVHKSNNFALLISRLEISHMIGFSRENVIRVLAEFNAEGILQISGKSIEILAPERLEEITRYS